MTRRVWFLALLLLPSLPALLPAQKTAPSKHADFPYYDFIIANSLMMWMGNDGMMSHDPLTDGPGMYWPAGSTASLVFNDGLLFGGKTGGTVHVGGATYRYGLQAGTILAGGSAADPRDPRFRIFWAWNLDRQRYNQLSLNLQAWLAEDFAEWPVRDGAPFTDRNGNGVYDPDFNAWLDDHSRSDEPLFSGEQVYWWVSNDLDASRTSYLYGTQPLGLEVQNTVWAFSEPGALDRTIFVKHKLINKGPTDITDMYIARWSDPDLGYGYDDCVGVDTALSLGYFYNGSERDSVYGSPPPAAGYLLLQGPIVPQAGASADFNFGTRAGYRNLPLSSFVFYINGSATYQDPVMGAPAGGQQMYNYLSGLIGTGAPFVDPVTTKQTKFTLSGDPVAKSGWVDGVYHQPDDRRFLMSTGPFTLARRDTQEVIFAFIVSLGNDRLNSVAELKRDAQYIKSLFRNGVVSGAAQPRALPAEISLRAWPNPFGLSSPERAAAANVEFDLPSRLRAVLRLYDPLGRLIATLADEELEAGHHRYPLQIPAASPSGVYRMELRAGMHRGIAKVVYLK